MNDYALDIISTLGAQADAGKLVPFGWGGPLSGWMRRLRQHIETEGYGEIDRPGWGLDVIQGITADLPEAPEGCECEGCQERRDDAARNLRIMNGAVDKINAVVSGRFIRWRHCDLCGQLSPRAGWAPDRLCPACFAGQA